MASSWLITSWYISNNIRWFNKRSYSIRYVRWYWITDYQVYRIMLCISEYSPHAGLISRDLIVDTYNNGKETQHIVSCVKGEICDHVPDQFHSSPNSLFVRSIALLNVSILKSMGVPSENHASMICRKWTRSQIGTIFISSWCRDWLEHEILSRLLITN